jgi:hypothetical protein
MVVIFTKATWTFQGVSGKYNILIMSFERVFVLNRCVLQGTGHIISNILKIVKRQEKVLK